MAYKENYKEIITDSARKSYTPSRFKKYKVLLPILTRIGKPTSYERFIIQARACMNHNLFDELYRIICPTLIIGGGSDQVVGSAVSEEMAGLIHNSKLKVYENLGHSAYEETKDFNRQVIDFLLSR
jgi:pimeloyl-ACP methyl ester carboxylesterase